jgi:uncharacterized protein
MPRPFGTPDDCVDVAALARTGSSVERAYSGVELARLIEAGGAAESTVSGTFKCAVFEQRTTLHGELHGRVVLTCQRCLGPVSVSLEEQFELVVVRDEAEAALEVGGYEPIIADPTRVDVRWLIEEQALLALPLVPMHEPGECGQSVAPSEEDEAPAGQRPFGNLRELLGKR